MDAGTLPLTGVKVLDLSQVLAGPYCTMMLGDLGADVVKVERPGTGDGSRAWGPPFAGGESTYFLQANRNKRSIAVDLKSPMGCLAVQRLAQRSDVLMENFLPGATERFGLDYESVRTGNPGIVYCSIRGYPSTGSHAERPGYDFAIQGVGGIMSVTGESDGQPMKVGVAIADITAGMFACSGILAALVERARDGRGRAIEVSLLDSQVAWLANRAAEWLIGGVEPARLGNEHPSIVPYQTFEAADGHVNVAAGSDDQFLRFCRAAGRDDLAADPKYASNRGRVEQRASLIGELARTIRTQPVAYWIELMERERIPGGPVLTIPETFTGPAADTVEAVEHPSAGAIRLVRSPIRLEGGQPGARIPPPLLGQHTVEVLREAGFTEREIRALLASGSISAASSDER